MSVVYVSSRESIDEAIERLNKKVRNERLPDDYRKHSTFMTRAEQRRNKEKRHRRRLMQKAKARRH